MNFDTIKNKKFIHKIFFERYPNDFDWENLALQQRIVSNFYNLILNERDDLRRNLYLIAGFKLLGIFLFYFELFFSLSKYSKDKKLKTLSFFKKFGKNINVNSLRNNKWSIDLFNKPKFIKIRELYQNIKFRKFDLLGNHINLISNNSILINELNFQGKKFKFTYPESLFLKNDNYNNQKYNFLINYYFNGLFKKIKVPSKDKNDIKKILYKDALEIFSLCSFHIDSLNKNFLPNEIWATSAGKYSSRIIGLYLKSKGKKIVRFTHGNPIGYLLKNVDPYKILDMFPSTKLIFPTKIFSDLVKKNLGLKEIKKLKCEVDYLKNKKNYEEPKYNDQKPKKKKKILYCPTLFRGKFQYFAPIIQDKVALKFHLNFIKQVKKLNLSFDVLPHPEGMITREKIF